MGDGKQFKYRLVYPKDRKFNRTNVYPIRNEIQRYVDNIVTEFLNINYRDVIEESMKIEVKKWVKRLCAIVVKEQHHMLI